MPRCGRFFFDFTARLTESFPNLYSEGPEEGSDFSAAGGFAKKWSGYQTIVTLSGGDLTKFDQVTLLPLFTCLTFLSYKVDESVMIEQQYKNKGQ
jgi:hypothetical protein